MTIKFGNIDIQDMKLGSKQVNACYLGSIKVWEKQSAFTYKYSVYDNGVLIDSGQMPVAGGATQQLSYKEDSEWIVTAFLTNPSTDSMKVQMITSVGGAYNNASETIVKELGIGETVTFYVKPTKKLVKISRLSDLELRIDDNEDTETTLWRYEDYENGFLLGSRSIIINKDNDTVTVSNFKSGQDDVQTSVTLPVNGDLYPAVCKITSYMYEGAGTSSLHEDGGTIESDEVMYFQNVHAYDTAMIGVKVYSTDANPRIVRIDSIGF